MEKKRSNYFNIIKRTEEYHWLKSHGVPFDDIMFYFNQVAIYEMRNEDKHRKRHIISLDGFCMTDSGDYGPAFRYEDLSDRYEPCEPIIDQISSPALKNALLSFSPRRREIVELKVQGYSGVEIAKKLGISPPAVTKHLKAIQETLAPFREI